MPSQTPNPNPAAEKPEQMRVRERRELVVELRASGFGSWQKIANEVARIYADRGKTNDLPGSWGKRHASLDYATIREASAKDTRANLDLLRGEESAIMQRDRAALDILLRATMPKTNAEGKLEGGSPALATNVINMKIRLSESLRKLWAADEPPGDMRKIAEEMYADAGLSIEERDMAIKNAEKILRDGR